MSRVCQTGQFSTELGRLLDSTGLLCRGIAWCVLCPVVWDLGSSRVRACVFRVFALCDSVAMVLAQPPLVLSV